eukprot:TRINITY_DN9890_c0_g1_i1.p1 TRINITY_DN9890_c0_g1~~TRINITY_DN9890_c0_g1_i1.p1  ORF type:complete len:329 (+),score=61.90 TRINITY_DN9890_c0_g1_i1:122-1108(+)
MLQPKQHTLIDRHGGDDSSTDSSIHSDYSFTLSDDETNYYDSYYDDTESMQVEDEGYHVSSSDASPAISTETLSHRTHRHSTPVEEMTDEEMKFYEKFVAPREIMPQVEEKDIAKIIGNVNEAADIKLYWTSGNPFCRIVQIMLMEKNIPFSSHHISIMENMHRMPEFMAMNPRGKLPVLVDGDTVLTDWNAMLWYLEENYTDVILAPFEPGLRATCMTRILETDYLLNAMYTFKPFFLDSSLKQTHGNEFMVIYENFLTELDHWDFFLKDSVFLIGDTFTMADVPFLACLALCTRLGFDFDTPRYSNINDYWDLVSHRESVVNSHLG